MISMCNWIPNWTLQSNIRSLTPTWVVVVAAADPAPRYDLPDALPPHGLAPDVVRATRYGLRDKAPEVFSSESINQELQQFEAWNKALLNVARPLGMERVNSTRTWNRVVSHISGLLGFFWLHAPTARPMSLALIRDHYNPDTLR